MKQNYINHIALVLDKSPSMTPHKQQLVRAVDHLVTYLAERSKDLGQETRVTIYTFNSTVECLVYDMDVLRLPSIKDHYDIPRYSRTALRDATGRAINDLKMTATLYGDHAFLMYVLTDGMENDSHLVSPFKLSEMLNNLPDNWTVAALVPNNTGKFEAKSVGFPAGNVEIWDTTSVTGVTEASEVVLRATDRFMTARSTGVRSSRNIFSTGADAVNTRSVKQAGLTPLSKDQYAVLDVAYAEQIRPYVEGHGMGYSLGCAYYQLSKTENIQPQKQIIVRNKRTGAVYTGREARNLIGLPDIAVRVTPNHNPEFDVFVQSTSVNRKLVPGTKLIVMK